ncbi:DNA cytosine methyltransferase [Gilvimarinus japonicus]|uniref:Cytosine-specific methyltransferase n=1 Tax=Gilvimarinus japonicus TaxID=1796469 RepID=A0ABV7HKS0_9GAMM
MSTRKTLVIDLFAGPGGLGEGISSCKDKNGNYLFEIGVSVEKEISAHTTLTTRAFYRKIKDNSTALKNYFSYLDGSISRQELFNLYPEESQRTIEETLNEPRALGEDNDLIHKRIADLVKKHEGPKIVIGGPPCQAYSLAGRSRNAGIEGYKSEDDHRNYLYLEYLKVLCIAQPEVFVMENVRGILSAKVNGEVIFPKILEDLSSPGRVTKKKGIKGYKIYSLATEAEDPLNPSHPNSSDYLIRSELYGIPQARHRVILLGVRDDITKTPKTLKSADKLVTVDQVISDLPALRSGLSKRKDVTVDWEKTVRKHEKRLTEILYKKFDTDAVKNIELKPIRNLKRKEKNPHLKSTIKAPRGLKSWYRSKAPKIVLNHDTRGHIESDLLRYAFSAAYTKLSGGTSPKARDFPAVLAPKHENWNSGSHADRFRTQAANKPSTTVTSHISKDGHYFIHYDPRQCRSLTVREVARLQTFPDNYFFEGNRTQQYVQVGNAVPPFLAQQIGVIVMELLSRSE